MSEKISNGDFDTDLNGWVNGPWPREAYVWDDGKIRANAYQIPELLFWIEQEFVVTHEVVSALCTVWAGWESYLNGYAEFVVIIRKPSLTEVELYHETEAGTIDAGYVVDGLDISAHLDEYGNYKLILLCAVSAGDPAVYDAYGWFDKASINIAIKKKKTVVEGRGSAPSRSTGPQRTVLEKRGMTESKSTRVLRGIQVALTTLGRTEIIGRKVKKTVMEFLGRAETLLRTLFMQAASEVCGRTESYVAVKIGPGFATEGIGRSETMTAKRTAGNVETTYAFIGDTEWDEILGVTTNWIKTKSEILGG